MQKIPEISQHLVIAVIQLKRLLSGLRSSIELAEVRIRDSHVLVCTVRGPYGYGIFQRPYRLFIPVFIKQDGAKILVVPIVVSPERYSLLEHGLRFLVFGLTEIKDAQTVVAAPIVRTDADTALQGLLSFLELVQILVRLGEMPIRLIIGGVKLGRLQELFHAFLIFARAIFNGSQTRVALGAGIAQFDCLGAMFLRRFNPVLLPRQIVKGPIRLAQSGFCWTVVRV